MCPLRPKPVMDQPRPAVLHSMVLTQVSVRNYGTRPLKTYPCRVLADSLVLWNCVL